MVEHAADFEWRGEGEEAEVVLYATSAQIAGRAFGRALPAARLPGVEGPVYAAASSGGFGLVAPSFSHAAPDLCSVPVRGMLLVAEAPLRSLGVPPSEATPLLRRRLSEVRVPYLTDAGVRRFCEAGAHAAAEDGLLGEEDLAFLDPLSADADALGRRTISAGAREWGRHAKVAVYEVGEILDTGAAEEAGLYTGTLALVFFVGAGDLGRLALAGHRERILSRVRGGDLGAEEDLPAAPVDAAEAADLLAALRASANFADARAALLLYALRRALDGVVAEDLGLRAAWKVGGIAQRDGYLVHRENLAAVAEGEVLVAGGSVAAGTGKMYGSTPPFADREDADAHPWEEAGLLERWAELDPPEGKG